MTVKNLTLLVQGMHCASCVNTIERSLKKVKPKSCAWPLRGVVTAIALSKATMRNIKQNLFWAYIYNTLGIPLAAGVLYPFLGVLLNPVFAALAMAFSSVSVVSNALRLRGFRPPAVVTLTSRPDDRGVRQDAVAA